MKCPTPTLVPSAHRLVTSIAPPNALEWFSIDALLCTGAGAGLGTIASLGAGAGVWSGAGAGVSIGAGAGVSAGAVVSGLVSVVLIFSRRSISTPAAFAFSISLVAFS